MFLAIADPVGIAIGFGSVVGTLLAAWLAYRTRLLEHIGSSFKPPNAHAEDAQRAADRAEATALAFAPVIVDLQSRIELCRTEAAAASERAQIALTAAQREAEEARAAEARCTAEQNRLEAMVEGILRDRRES